MTDQTKTPRPAARNIKHVVILIQENHTTDNYFRGLAPYGANVATGWPTQPNPPASDQPHDRHAYYKWLQSGHAVHTQFDTTSVLPYYAYLALTGAFLDNHCSGFGTNSTPNHLILVGGQSPTMRNPPRTKPPVWDMPSLPGLAGDNGISWRCYTAAGGYPVSFYTQLTSSPHLAPTAQFAKDAHAGALAALSYVWHASPPTSTPPPTSPSEWRRSRAPSTRSCRPARGTRPSSCSPGTTGTTTWPPRTSSTPPTASSAPTDPGCRC